MDATALPESRLPADLRGRLPDRTPGPPWDCRVRAVVWLQRGVQRGVQRAPSPLPPGSPFRDRARGLTVAALVDYLDTPVGPYREVFAGPLLRGALLPVVHVPFIAVDSLASVHGGREHWALPKVLADFSGAIASGPATVTGPDWSVRVQARAYGPRLPLLGPLYADQGRGPARVQLRGRGRAARVHVAAHGPTLSGWLGTGSHPGVVAEGRMVVHAAG